MKDHSRNDLDRFRELLKKTTPADFDGHTDFRIMTPEERLMWLSQSAQFSVEFMSKI